VTEGPPLALFRPGVEPASRKRFRRP